MLARCHQLQSIFRLLKPFLHVQIWSQSVAVFQNHGVIHVEILTSIDTPSFQNALTRFIAVRGTCKRFRSFIGGAEPDSVVEGDVDLDELRASMNIRGIECIFNPQMLFRGVWERKIQSLKKDLNGTQLLLGPQELTLDEFKTFVVEASSIVNNAPL